MSTGESQSSTCPLCSTDNGVERIALFAVPTRDPIGQLIYRSADDTGTRYQCPRCGSFILTTRDEEHFLRQGNARNQVEVWKLSALTYEHTVQSLPIAWIRFSGAEDYTRLVEAPPLGEVITHYTPVYHVDITNRWPRNVAEKLNRTLCNLARLSHIAGERIEIGFDNPAFAFGICRDESEFLLKSLIDVGLLSEFDAGLPSHGVALTAKGWERFDELTRGPGSPKNPVFVAMWFGGDDEKRKREMNDLYTRGIEPAISDAGYKATRVDLEPHSDFIMNKVLGDIRLAPFVVADFTGHRHGVYFEAGFARGLNIPVIHACKGDEFDGAHFDTKQLPHLLWESAEDLREKLREWIRGWLGEGPYASSPPDANSDSPAI